VGMVPFSDSVYGTVPLADIGTARSALKQSVNTLKANGRTALLDGVAFAYDDLQRRGERDRINTIVVMTDGIENASSLSLSRLTQKIKSGNASGVPVIIFCIAYGSDADMNTMTAIAEPTGGFARRADPDTIRKLYRILSTYF
jgi:Ca-activated chloride channel family protein